MWQDASAMDSWRLSKIEEELERVDSPSPRIFSDPDFPPPPPPDGYGGSMEWPKSRDHSPFGTLERSGSRDNSPFNTLERGGTKSRDQSPFGTLERLKYAAAGAMSGAGAGERGRSMTPNGTLERSHTPSGTLERRQRSLTPSGTLERSQSFSNTVDSRDPPEDIYSKIVVKKGYSKEDMEQEAIKHFTGKYESLGKVMLGAMSPRQEVKHIARGAHEEDFTLPTVYPEPIAPLPPATPPQQLRSPTTPLRTPTSPLLRTPTSPCPSSPQMSPLTSPTSPTSPTMQRDVIIRPRGKPPPLPPSVPQSPSSPHAPPLPPTSSSSSSSSRPSSASAVRSSHRQSQGQGQGGGGSSSERVPGDQLVRRSHSQSSCQRQPLKQHPQHQQQPAQSSASSSATLRPKASAVTALTEADITQTEMFFRSHKTEVFVCQCMANLYEGNVRMAPSNKPGEPPIRAVEIWNYIKPGIPVFVLDSGESRRARKLSILLSERGTGFPLWKETMTHLTNYRADKATFHTMHVAKDQNKMMALSFDDPVAANEFIHILHSIASNPDDDILNLGTKKKRKDAAAKKKLKQKYKAPNKADISSPCCFTHVTNLSAGDGMSKVVGATPPPPSRNSATSPTSSMTSLIPRARGGTPNT